MLHEQGYLVYVEMLFEVPQNAFAATLCKCPDKFRCHASLLCEKPVPARLRLGIRHPQSAAC
jgi:hypothetical protein